MLCCLFKCYMFDLESICLQKLLCFFGKLMYDFNFWYFNCYLVLCVMVVGLFVVFILMLMQMLLVVGLVVWIWSNLLIFVGLVWLINLIMMFLVFYCIYKLGVWLMQVLLCILLDYFIWEWISQELFSFWQFFLFGLVVCGIIVVIFGYVLMMFYWCWWVQCSWS